MTRRFRFPLSCACWAARVRAGPRMRVPMRRAHPPHVSAFFFFQNGPNLAPGGCPRGTRVDSILRKDAPPYDSHHQLISYDNRTTAAARTQSPPTHPNPPLPAVQDECVGRGHCPLRPLRGAARGRAGRRRRQVPARRGGVPRLRCEVTGPSLAPPPRRQTAAPHPTPPHIPDAPPRRVGRGWGRGGASVRREQGRFFLGAVAPSGWTAGGAQGHAAPLHVARPSPRCTASGGPLIAAHPGCRTHSRSPRARRTRGMGGERSGGSNGAHSRRLPATGRGGAAARRHAPNPPPPSPQKRASDP